MVLSEFAFLPSTLSVVACSTVKLIIVNDGVLHNCLGSYQRPIDEGRSLVLGIFVRGHLMGAVEVDPAKRRIVQISSVKSRPLPKATRETVTAMLMSRGAVAPA